MNKLLIKSVLIISSLSYVEANATIFTSCIRSRNHGNGRVKPINSRDIDIVPIRSNTIHIDDLDYYPQRSILGSINTSKEKTYILKDSDYIVEVYNNIRFDPKEGGEIIPWSAEFKLLKKGSQYNYDNLISSRYRNDLLDRTDIGILKSINVGTMYFTEDKKYTIKRISEDNYAVYKTSKLIELGEIEEDLKDIKIIDSSFKVLDLSKYNNNTKEESIEMLRLLGINFKDDGLYEADKNILSDISVWLTAFNKKYNNFINRNNYKLISILSEDNDLKVGRFDYSYDSDKSYIYLSSKYFGNPDLFEDIVLSGIKAKYYTNNFTNLSGFVHEFGHYIEESISRAKKNDMWAKVFVDDVLKKFKKENSDFDGKISSIKNHLSLYAETNHSELFAEAFAEYYGGDNPRPFAKLFGEELDKILEYMSN